MNQAIGTQTLSDSAMTLLERVLDVRAERQTLIASNIANAETPRYQATDIDFEGALHEVMSSHDMAPLTRTNPRHLPVRREDRVAISPSLVYRQSAGVSNDRNSVDLDTEMAQLAQNNLLYNAAAQLLAKKIGMLRQAIDGGK